MRPCVSSFCPCLFCQRDSNHQPDSIPKQKSKQSTNQKMNPRLLAAGGVVYVGMATATYVYMRATTAGQSARGGGGNSPGEGVDTMATNYTDDQNSREIDRGTSPFDRLADSYDSRINLDELVMGVKLLRWWLLRQARGDVLEVSAGTGRNLNYYSLPKNDKLTSLTLSDASREMLLQCYDKYKTKFGSLNNNGQSSIPVNFMLVG